MIVPVFIGTEGNKESVTQEQAHAAAERALGLSYCDKDIAVLRKYLFQQNGVRIGGISKDLPEKKQEEFAGLVFGTFCDRKYELPFFREHLLGRSADLDPINILGELDDKGLTLEKNYVPITFMRHLTSAEQKERERRMESTAPAEAGEDALLSALEKERLALVVGDAGQGKTSFVKHLFIRLADEACRYELSQDMLFPIYAECKNIKGDLLSGKNDFLHALAEGAHILFETLKTVLRFGKPLLILDAMDEVSPTRMDALVTAVYSYIFSDGHYNKTHIIFTSRPGQKLVAGNEDMTLGRKDGPVVRRYSVRELDEKQRDDYITKLSGSKNVDDNTREAFFAALKDKEDKIADYRLVSRNPFMLLAVFSTYAKGQELPANRFDAVSRIIDDVIRRDLKKCELKNKDDRQIGPDEIKAVLGAVSFEIYSRRDEGETVYFDTDAVCGLAQRIYGLDFSSSDDRETLNDFRSFFSTSRLLDENGFRHEFLASTYAAYYLLFMLKKKTEPLTAGGLSELIGKDADYWKSVTEALLCLLDRRSVDSKIYIEPLLSEMQNTPQPDYDTLCGSVSQFTNHQSRAAGVLLSEMLERGCEGIMYGERNGSGFICKKGVNPYEELFYFPAVYPELRQYLRNMTADSNNSAVKTDADQYLCGELIREVCALFSAEYHNELQVIYKSRRSSAYPEVVKKLSDAADRRHRDLRGYVRIRDGETEIGFFAFFERTGLTGITIPDSVTYISIYVFAFCTGLTVIAIPDSVTEIQEGAFLRCTGLTRINVDENNPCYSSKDGVLFNKEKTAIILYPAGKMGEYTIPDSVKEIGNDTFRDCTGLTSIDIPAGVTEIGHSAFSDCTGLKNITIPDSVTKIGNHAFSGCTRLTGIDVDESNPHYSSINGGLFNKEKTEIISYPAGKMGEYTIPDSVKEIGNDTFRDCTGLTSVTIPADVTEIGRSAFQNCTSLTDINVDDMNPCYSSIDGVLFNKEKTAIILYPAGKMGEYTIPASVTAIETDAFSGCTGLKNITIPDGVTEIGMYAFSNCTLLTGITIPDSVTEIRVGAFSGCTGLTGINVDKNNIYYSSSDGVLFNKEKTAIIVYPKGKKGSYTIPNRVAAIRNNAFSGCTGLTCIAIPTSVTEIGGGAFHTCKGLTSVTIPDGVTIIHTSTFAGCTSLTSITIPDSVTWIWMHAFSACPNLTIRGKKGSYAEYYANEENIPFIPE